MPRPISYAVFCLKKKKKTMLHTISRQRLRSYSLVSSALFLHNESRTTEIYTLSLHDALPILFGAIAGGIASALAGGAMSKLFGGGQKAASGGIQGDVLATDNNTVGMG